MLEVMLRQNAVDWTPERVQELIDSREVPETYVQSLIRYVARKSSLWTVSDEEFISAVDKVNPACARIIATPRGIDFLHRMSNALAGKLVMYKLGLAKG